jgi:fatty-acyl-CoA synthase
MTALAHGATLVVVSPAGFRDPDAVRDIWLTTHKHRLTILGAVPTVLGAMLNIPIGNSDISSLRYFATGGSALPVEVGRALADLTDKPVFEGYGMTETTSYVTFPAVGGDMCLGSVGIVLPHCRVRVVELDASGDITGDCAVGEIGVVVMKGPSITPGYVQSHHNEGSLLADGWLNSGDLGRFDNEGRLWLTGRAKDLIIRGGHNIDPAVIEETLYQHPAVEMAAAVGKPDGYAGELPVVYIQLRPGAEADATELQAFAREHIPERAATPVNVFLIETMPLTAVGKIFKPALRWAAAETVFAEILAPVAEDSGREVGVSVGSDDVYGAIATVRVGGGRDDTIAARVAELLAPFTLRHKILWD